MQTAIEAKKRVLVVDDEPEIRDFFCIMLTELGLQVDLAASAAEAMDLYRQHQYDLVTLDFCMPGMDGIQFQKRLSSIFGLGHRLPSMLPQRLPPTLVITAYSSSETDQEWLKCEQIVGVMQKPIRSREFLSVVRNVLSSSDTRRKRRTQALTRLSKHLVKPMPA